MTLKHRQRGATLFVALVMLVVLTLLSISAIRSSSINLRIAGNMQMAGEGTAAAQQAIEQVLSTNFTAAPAESDIAVDINGSGTTDYSAHVFLPQCTGSVPLKNGDLDMTSANDQKCFSSSTASNTGIFFASGAPAVTGMSWCLSQQWDVSAQATSFTGTDVTLHQGVALRVPAGTGC